MTWSKSIMMRQMGRPRRRHAGSLPRLANCPERAREVSAKAAADDCPSAPTRPRSSCSRVGNADGHEAAKWNHGDAERVPRLALREDAAGQKQQNPRKLQQPENQKLQANQDGPTSQKPMRSQQLTSTNKRKHHHHHHQQPQPQPQQPQAATDQMQTQPQLAPFKRPHWPATPLKSLLLPALALSLLLMSLQSLQTTEARQSFAAQPEARYFVPNGHAIKLPCHVSERQGECAWLGGNARIIRPNTKKYVYASQPSDGDCSVLIKNANVSSDDGLWQCQVLAPDGDPDTSMRTRNSLLVVLVPPERAQIKDLSPGPNRLILEEKKEKNITCEIRGGNPAPTVEWYLDGKSVTHFSHMVELRLTDEQLKSPATRLVQSRIQINNIKRTLNGKNLTCVGVHQTQNQSASIELDVQYVPSVSVPQKEYTLIEGTPLHVPCLVEANPNANSVQWRFVGHDKKGNAAASEALVSEVNGPILEVSRVSRAYNRNSYQCVATNALGSSSPIEVKLNVLYPPRATNVTESGHVLVGSSQQLYCGFDGNPAPEIKWLYVDPLSRTLTSVAVDNSRDLPPSQQQQQQQAASQQQQQTLIIRNVTYRNEGEYICEARNTINGHVNVVRSMPINLDVFGEPQFLAKSPVHAKTVQGSKSDVSLTFCSDPPPNKVFWQFGSIRVDVKLPGDLRAPSNERQQALQRQPQTVSARYQAQPLQPLQRRDSNFSKPPTCFEATLTLGEPEMSDQRDYALMVQNEQGLAQGIVRVRVSSPLSPALMITSAFVFIFGLFMCSLLFLFVFKKRQHFMGGSRRSTTSANGGGGGATGASAANGTDSQANGNSSSSGGRVSRKNKNLLAGANGNATPNGTKQNGQLQANGNSQQQQQTKGVVNGAGNGLANGASNPITSMMTQDEHLQLNGAKVHGAGGLMSMASSDTSCNDQKQLLASNCSDRNSSAGSSQGVASVDVSATDYAAHLNHQHLNHHLGHRHHHHHSNSVSPASTPSPMNLHHGISVDDELHLNGSYQATESITRGARLSPPLNQHAPNGISNGHTQGLIYANIDYSAQALGGQDGDDDADDAELPAHSPQTSSTLTMNNKRASLASSSNMIQRPQLSPGSGSNATIQESRQQQAQAPSPRPSGSPQLSATRPSVGATIAMMNNLAAAQSKAAALNSPLSNGGLSSPATGVLSQHLMATVNSSAGAGRIRKPGPPKPPKPSIQQRSRFYQQQAAASGGLVMIGNSQMGLQRMPIDGNHPGLMEPNNNENETANDLAGEYSRLAFPARAEL